MVLFSFMDHLSSGTSELIALVNSCIPTLHQFQSGMGELIVEFSAFIMLRTLMSWADEFTSTFGVENPTYGDIELDISFLKTQKF